MVIDDAESDENERLIHWNAPLGESDASDEWVSGDEHQYSLRYKSTVLAFLDTEDGVAFQTAIMCVDTWRVRCRSLQTLSNLS